MFTVIVLVGLAFYVNYSVLPGGYSTNKECYPFCDDVPVIDEGPVEVVHIKLLSEEKEYFFEKPVDLVINGIGGKVKILENSNVKFIAIRGDDITLLLPNNLRPKIINMGISFNLSY